MSDNPNAVLIEIRDLLREQNALMVEVRDMNRESMQRLRESQERNEKMLDRTERMQAKTERTFTVSNLVVYGAGAFIALLLLGVLRTPWW